MANKNLQGTIEYYIKGQYGLIKGEDGKEYCFGRKAVTARAKLFNGDVVRFTVDQKHHILALKVTSYVAVRSKIRKALANKGYSFQSEKGGKWSVIVKSGDRKLVLKEYGHMTLQSSFFTLLFSVFFSNILSISSLFNCFAVLTHSATSRIEAISDWCLLRRTV